MLNAKKCVYLKSKSKDMKLFLITYDLKQPGRNYSELYELIKSLAGENNWQHPLESTWMIKVSDSTTVDGITTQLRTSMDTKDSIFVVDISRMPYQGWLPKSFWDWMKN